MATKNLLQFIIRGDNGYLKVNGGIYWVVKDEANKYPSRYAAKRHLNMMAIHDEVKIEEYVRPEILRTGDLPADVVNDLQTTKMSKQHNYLNQLMDD